METENWKARYEDVEQNNLELQDDLIRIMQERNRLLDLVTAHPFCNRCGKCDDMELDADASHYDVSMGHSHVRCLTDDERAELEDV